MLIYEYVPVWFQLVLTHLKKQDFDFPRYKKIHILQENTLWKLADIILLLEQHEPLVLIWGFSKVGTLYLATLPGNTFPYETVLEDPLRSSFGGVCLNLFPLSITFKHRFNECLAIWFFELSPQSLNKVLTGDDSLFDGPSNPCLPYGTREYSSSNCSS